MTARDIVEAALLEMGGIGIEETADDAIAVFGLAKLNRILDNWNAERAAVYAQAFNTYVLTPSLTPHTIGPTGTFVVTQRPVSIEGAALLITTSTPNASVPINIRDAQWWQDQSVKGLTSSVPTDLYYEPDWPNGKLFFWPVPTTAYSVEIQSRIVLAELSLATTYTLPPGYRDATILTLAENLCDPLGKTMSPVLAEKAAKARARAFNNNDVTPRLRTRDAGMPSARRGAESFNYLSRTWSS